jgi:hypothetical protein
MNCKALQPLVLGTEPLSFWGESGRTIKFITWDFQCTKFSPYPGNLARVLGLVEHVRINCFWHSSVLFFGQFACCGVLCSLSCNMDRVHSHASSERGPSMNIMSQYPCLSWSLGLNGNQPHVPHALTWKMSESFQHWCWPELTIWYF